jgi:acyl dehydratase
MTQKYFEDLAEGQSLDPLVIPVTTQQLVFWAAASGDFYQIHYDKDYALGNNLPGVIVHGALKHAIMGRYLDELAGPGGFVHEFGCSFRGMDQPGNDLAIKATVTAKKQEDGKNLVELEVWTENPEGQKTSPGTAVVELPSRA